MLQKTLNLGILAHVDAGKTTLTERLLYEAGVIDEPGSVDAGTTQTDSLTLERQRGITIRSAVASFAVDDVHVNLIDTPGHPDFIAEVERVLSVLDGAVLVLSAVEGVQPQTRILMRALQRLRIPTLVFVNKIDRPGADDERVVQEIAERLTTALVPMGTAQALGTRVASFTLTGEDSAHRAQLAELLAERDEGILAAYVEGESDVPYDLLRDALAVQTKRALVHPVFFGSAITGAGVVALLSGITELLPAAAGDPAGPVSGTVFKIERGASGEKIAYVRMFSGTIHTRDRLRFGHSLERKVTAIAVFERGPAEHRPAVSAGAVAQLWGLAEIQVGDRIGEIGTDASDHHFAPPTLESVVIAGGPDDRARLRVASARTTPGRSSLSRSTAKCRRKSSRRRWQTSTASTSHSAKRRRSTSSGPAAPARRSSSSTRNRIRISRPSGCASTPRRTAPGSISDYRSILARSRSTSTRRSKASRSAWVSTSATRCGRASSAGRSRTAS